MEVLTVLIWLAIPLVFILVLGEIASRIMGDIWAEFQKRPYRKPLCQFRGISYLTSLCGLGFGYYWGYHQPTQDCGIGVIGCGVQAFFNGVQTSVAGAFLGATFGVMGLAFFLQLRK